MMKRILNCSAAAFLLAASLMTISCDGGATVEVWEGGKVDESGAAAALSALEGKALFFGHQSVGDNILQGIREIGSGLHISDLHIGQNGDPLSKIATFEEVLTTGKATGDIAFMKLCYVDFSAGSDAQALFDEYARAAARIEAAQPELKLVHFTAPLTRRETGPKASLKRALGRDLDGENVAREAYNELIRAAYGPGGRVFDIALLEASDAEGGLERHTAGGKGFIALRPEYTDDGGHLNERGRRRVASALLEFLSGL